MLLYLVTKNHSFSDGNKRIAATLFLWFLNNNGILYHEDCKRRCTQYCRDVARNIVETLHAIL